MSKPPKIKLGMFSFSGCEGETIMLTVLMNKYLTEWLKRIDFVEGRAIRKKRSDEPLDVALVEGAIAGEEDVEKIKKIRERAKILVAIGSCACTGMPAGLRNNFSDELKKEVKVITDKFDYVDKVRSLSDVVKVDAEVQGCPMNERKFLEALNGIFEKFGHKKVTIIED